MHGKRRVPGKGSPAGEILEPDAEARPAAVRNSVEGALQVAHPCLREPWSAFLIRRSLQPSGVAEGGLEERAVERRDLDARDVVARRLKDGPVADPHRLVVDLLLRAEEEEVTGEKSFERHGDEAWILKSLLVAVPFQDDAVLREDPLHQPRAVEAQRRRPAPGVRCAEEALPESNPIRRGTKRGILLRRARRQRPDARRSRCARPAERHAPRKSRTSLHLPGRSSWPRPGR